MPKPDQTAADGKNIDERNPLTPIPLVILSGFLGAGKTTRLNTWLKHPALEDTLVIINEFGEIGLDHLLIEEAPGDVVLLAAGCLCCTIRGDLVATLEDLLRRRDNHRIRFFRQVLIETTGLADPLPILQSVLQHPYLSKRFTVSGLVTLVDAVNGSATLAAYPEARRQVALADRLLVTKTDLVRADELATLETGLRALNPTVPPLTDPAAFDPAKLFDRRFEPRAASGQDVLEWLGETETTATLASGHGVGQHGAEITSHTFISAEAISEASLIVFQEAMRILHGPRLLRLKGLIALREDPGHPVVIHHVQSVAHKPVKLLRWPGRDRRTRLVVITQGIARETIAGFWDALVKADAEKA
ncbi:MAG: cobalamin synthesis protein [Beijerinckiaceae bacterium]|nr:MAG: cobalamin synthesis protein [Beijerinckiaceae bacterium]